MMTTVYTIGHSNQPVSLLLDGLAEHEIGVLVDVRRFPRSRRNPQFNLETLSATLAKAGTEYRHVEALGGRREPAAESANAGLRDPGFRGYADYMATTPFEQELDALIAAASRRRLAVMCAESLPWKCHRSLIADALLARGVEVRHILGATLLPHTPTPACRVGEGRVTYPSLL